MSIAGIFPFAPSVDQPGYFCNSLEDMDYAAPILVDAWQGVDEVPRPVLGVVSGAYYDQADTTARQSFEHSMKLLANQGFRVVEHDLFPDIAAINTSHRELIATEFALAHRELFSRYGKLYSAHSQELYAQGQGYLSLSSPDPQGVEALLRRRIEESARELGIDLWITPAATSAAPLGIESTGSPLMSLPFSNAGVPTLCVPAKPAPNGLPMGIQIAAAFGGDEYLLAAAMWLLS